MQKMCFSQQQHTIFFSINLAFEFCIFRTETSQMSKRESEREKGRDEKKKCREKP